MDAVREAEKALEYYRQSKAYENVVGELIVADRCVAIEALAKLRAALPHG